MGFHRLKTLVLGASENPMRYSYKAANMLTEKGHDIFLVGKQKGKFLDKIIEIDFSDASDIHTVTLYLNAINQEKYYQNILDLKPQRVIFNPGTENPEFQEILDENNINWTEACTLVLLSTNQF